MVDVIDDFESGDLSAYTGSHSETQVSSNISHNGTYALLLDGWDSNDTSYYSVSGDGLANYPEKGQVFEFYIYLIESQDGGGTPYSEVGFGTQDASNTYTVAFSSNFEISKLDGGTGSVIDSVSPSYAYDEWMRCEVDWGTDDLIQVTLEDSNGTQLHSISGTDSTFASNVGISFHSAGGIDTYIDDYQITDTGGPSAPSAPSNLQLSEQ